MSEPGTRVRRESGGVAAVPWKTGADRTLDGVAAEHRDDVRREVEKDALERGYASVSRELAEEALAAMRLAGP